MDRLGEIRAEINNIDREILCGLEQRSKLTQEIGEIKSETLAPVFVPQREDEIIKELESQASEGVRGMVAALFKTIMRLSRRGQYASIYNKLEKTEFGEQLSGAASKVAEIDNGKKPCLEVEFRNLGEVNNFFNIINDYGFYPLEFSLKERKDLRLVCRSVINTLEITSGKEKLLIKSMYQLCNEFESVRLVGWV